MNNCCFHAKNLDYSTFIPPKMWQKHNCASCSNWWMQVYPAPMPLRRILLQYFLFFFGYSSSGVLSWLSNLMVQTLYVQVQTKTIYMYIQLKTKSLLFMTARCSTTHSWRSLWSSRLQLMMASCSRDGWYRGRTRIGKSESLANGTRNWWLHIIVSSTPCYGLESNLWLEWPRTI